MTEQTSRELGTLRRLHELMCRVNAGEDLQTVLQSLVDGVADVAGFEIAAVSILQPNQEFEMLAVAGDDGARTELLGKRTPFGEIVQEFEIAENWGVLRFVPHERLNGDPQGWIPKVTPLDVADAWHPEDALLAPLHAPTGEMVGLLSVDMPVDGLRPAQFARDALDMYAVQAGIAISNAKQREQAREEIRLAGVVRDVARAVNSVLEPAEVLQAAVDPIRRGLHCDAVWLRTFDEGANRHGLRVVSGPDGPTPSGDVVALAGRVAREAWRARKAVMLAGRRPLWEAPGWDGSNPLLRPQAGAEELQLAEQWLRAAGHHSVMLVPVGAGPDCGGYLLLGQRTPTATWQAAEVESGLEIGREIGRALLRARVYEELREVDRYKTEMFATVAHELKSPLTAINGHVELLQQPDRAGGPEEYQTSVAAIDRATGRLGSLVEDLLVLARVSDPHRPLADDGVDLREVVLGVVEMFEAQAARQGVTVELAGLDEGLTVPGDATELDRMVSNLLGNAVKFSPDGGRVTITVARVDDNVVLRCADQGMGISQSDQQQLFSEFFRSTNPHALQVPGSGLGLTIVKRIVDRHDGAIQVESVPGEGTTFTVSLPDGSAERAAAV